MKVIVAAFLLSIVGYAAGECQHEALLPNPDDCTTFFQCYHNNLDLHHCPEGLTFHPAQKICDFPGPGDSCANGRVQGRTVPECPKQTRGEATHIADPDDCTSFYECDDLGNALHLHCPPGLAFNSILHVCDWPQNIEPTCEVSSSR